MERKSLFASRSANEILVAYVVVVCVTCMAIGVTVGIVVEVVVGGVLMFVAWPLAEWALRRDDANSHEVPR